MTRPDRIHNPFQAMHTMENCSDFLSANVSWISLGATHKREGWRKDLREVGPGVSLANVSGCHPLIARYWSRDQKTGLRLVGVNLGRSLIASSSFYPWSYLHILCRHIVIICSFMFYTRPALYTGFQNPWLTLYHKQSHLFLFFHYLNSKGHNFFFSYALVWYYNILLFRQQVARILVIFIEIRVFLTNGLWLHL